MRTKGRYANAELSHQYSASFDEQEGRLTLLGPLSEGWGLSLETARNLCDFLLLLLPPDPDPDPDQSQGPANSSQDNGGEGAGKRGITITHHYAISNERVNELAQRDPQVVKLLNWPFRIVEYQRYTFIVQEELHFEDWCNVASDGEHTDVSTQLCAAQRQIEQIEQQTSNEQ